eukprot:6205212-Pleurochrysis_carterae.AAC.1
MKKRNAGERRKRESLSVCDRMVGNGKVRHRHGSKRAVNLIVLLIMPETPGYAAMLHIKELTRHKSLKSEMRKQEWATRAFVAGVVLAQMRVCSSSLSMAPWAQSKSYTSESATASSTRHA